MPGNTTVYRDVVTFLPVFWRATGVTAAQVIGLDMVIPGMVVNTLPLARRASLMSLGIVLTTPVTNGFIRLEIMANGSPTGQTFDITPATGTKNIWTFSPGELVGSAGTDVGVQWGSNAGLLPTGVIDVAVFMEVQWI